MTKEKAINKRKKLSLVYLVNLIVHRCNVATAQFDFELHKTVG